MSETNNRRDSSSAQDVATPWQILLNGVERHAAVMTEEVMADSVLGESVMHSVSAYLAKRDELTMLRKEFAEADIFCSNLRKEAGELMHSLGYDFEWDSEDVQAVDEQLMSSMKEAIEKAATANKKRAEASIQESQLLDRTLEEIALCASIAVLRQSDLFTCDGEAFCVAFITTSMLRQKAIEDLPRDRGMDTLSEWLQYSIGVKTRAVELDIYAKNPVAANIGRGMGIESTSALRLALIDAMKKVHTQKAD